LRAGEAGDEQASAVSVALTILREIFGDNAFTARDVVKVMTPDDGLFMQPKADDADKARADAIGEALAELAGKRLDRPTSHGIGKLFQKTLVGRPAWIEGGQAVATLRKSAGHDENTYRVTVSAPGQPADASSANTSSPADPGPNFPDFPDIPQGGRTDDVKSGESGESRESSRRHRPQGHCDPSDANGDPPAWSGRI